MKNKYTQYNKAFKAIADNANTDKNFDEVFETETSYKFNQKRKAPCPFCGSGTSGKADSDGAFTYYPKNNIGKCFSCGTGTNIINFVKQINSFDYYQAIHHIAKVYYHEELIHPDQNINISTAKVKKPVKLLRRKKISEAEAKEENAKKQRTLNFLISTAKKNNKGKASKYLESRSLKLDLLPENSYYFLDKYKKNTHGVAFVSSNSECINKRNFGPGEYDKTFSYGAMTNSLYNCSFRKDSDSVYITEGVINALSIYQVEKSAISLFGTTNEIDDINKFSPYFTDKHVVIAFDFDKNFAGQKASLRRSFWIKKHFKTKSVSILIHPEGKDDNDLLKEDTLKSFLDNPYNYIYPTIPELNKFNFQRQELGCEFKPDLKIKNYESRPAMESEKDGDFVKETKEQISEEILGKFDYSGEVCQSTFSDCNIKYVEKFTSITNGKAYVHISTPENPIFTVKEKLVIRPFGKKPYKRVTFYESKNPQNWTYGLTQLELAFDNIGDDDDNNSKKKPKKLKHAILVFNFIDFINLSAIGENPIYLNGDLTAEIKKDILTYVYAIIVAPENKTISRKRANAITSKHISVKLYKTDTLFANISEYIREHGHFIKKHINTAMPLMFWKYDKKESNYKINSDILNNFLMRQGYFTYPNDFEKLGFNFIKKTGNIIEELEYDHFSLNVIIFTIKYLNKKGENSELKDRVINSSKFSEKKLSTLEKRFDLKPKYASLEHQNWFFTDGNMWTVTKNGITVDEYNNHNSVIWKSDIIDFPSKIKEAPFKIFHTKAYSDLRQKQKCAENKEEYRELQSEINKLEDNNIYDIDIIDRDNYMLQLLFLLSYAYFEKAEKTGYQVRANDFWYDKLPDLITAEELRNIKLHLINKITALGYLMNDHRLPQDDKGVIILDTIDDIEQTGKQRGASGGGKSMLMQGIELVKSLHNEPAEQEDFTTKDFGYSLYRRQKLIHWEDLHAKAKIGDRVNDFSKGIQVKRKFKDPVSIPFKDTPKIVITRNYMDTEATRVDRRLIRMFIFPFFHDSKGGVFNKTRKPSDIFKRQLFSGDNTEQKSQLINFYAYAYIANKKFGEINPPLTAMYRKRLINKIGSPLMDFLNNFFFESDENEDETPFGYIDRTPLFNKFITEHRDTFNHYQKNKHYSNQNFKHLVGDYCELRNYIFNPSDTITDLANNRIMRKSEEQLDKSGYPKRSEHFYINTIEGYANDTDKDSVPKPPTEIEYKQGGLSYMDMPEPPKNPPNF